MTSASDNLATLVDDMLQDAGLGQDADLRDVLLSLGTMGSLAVPAPAGELAALLADGAPLWAEEPVPGEPVAGECSGQPTGQATDQPEGDELARRRRRRHRPTALGLVLVAGMGLGVGGVAASTSAPGSSAIEHLVEDWVPWSGPAPVASAAGDGAVAAGPGYRAPELAADGLIGDHRESASTAAPGGADDAANLSSRLLRSSAGMPGRMDHSPCTGRERYGAGRGSGKCAGDATDVPAGDVQGFGAGGSKDAPLRAAAEGTPEVPGASGAGKAEPSAANTPAGIPGITGTGAQKSGGSPNTSEPAPGQNRTQDQSQGQSQGGSQGNGSKNPSPAK